MPVDIMYGDPNSTLTTVPQYVADLRLLHMNKYGQQCQQSLNARRSFTTARVHGQLFQPGDLMWRHSPAVPRGKSRKLHRPWAGPYQVVRRLSNAVYHMQHLQVRCKRLLVHFDRLSPDTRLQPAVSTGQRASQTLPSLPKPVGTDLEIVKDDSDRLNDDTPFRLIF